MSKPHDIGTGEYTSEANIYKNWGVHLEKSICRWIRDAPKQRSMRRMSTEAGEWSQRPQYSKVGIQLYCRLI